MGVGVNVRVAVGAPGGVAVGVGDPAGIGVSVGVDVDPGMGVGVRKTGSIGDFSAQAERNNATPTRSPKTDALLC